MSTRINSVLEGLAKPEIQEAIIEQHSVNEALREQSSSWSAVFYLERIDWNGLVLALESMMLPCAFIEHQPEQDENKTHVHVIWYVAQGISRSNLIRLMNRAGLQGCYPSDPRVCPQRVRDRVAMNRYLIHADDKAKTQYQREQVRTLYGYELVFQTISGQHSKDAAFLDVCRFVFELNICEYRDLVWHVSIEHPEWARIVGKDFAYALKQLCDSNRYAYQRDRSQEEPNREDMGVFFGEGIKFERISNND